MKNNAQSLILFPGGALYLRARATKNPPFPAGFRMSLVSGQGP